MQFTLSRALVCAFLVWSLPAAAQNSGPAPNGDFQFGLAGAQGAVQYDARSSGSSAKGQMTFSGAMEISNEDVDGSGEGSSPASNVTMTVAFDCLRIASDAERPDDIPVPTSHAKSTAAVDCSSFPFGSYDLRMFRTAQGRFRSSPDR